MAKSFEVRITDHAEQALQRLANYIAYDLFAPQTAISYIKELRDGILSLSTLPERFALTPEEPWHTYGIHQMIVKNHFVYYWVDKDNYVVYITDVIYVKSDKRKSLEMMPLV
ncbi:MAG: type II toxin-antitoxin system RelE/ParE family toxin [Anaerolineaceae bacterium]|nr:type II toxin-antitoxin system RelE/ParE family toxin [Anaerolineaceae bacterium]